MPFATSLSDHADRALESCLIVDDNMVDRRQMREVIQRDRPEMQTFEFSSLSEARAYLKTAGADIILLDNHLPDGRGADLAADLRADPRHKDTPIIVVTGDDISMLDFGVTALSKEDLSARNLGDLVGDFLKARRMDRAADSQALVQDLQLDRPENLMPAFSRAVRTLRAARAQVSRSAPFAAIHALDEVEDTLVALAQVVAQTEARKS